MRTDPVCARCWVAMFFALSMAMVQGGCLAGPVPSDRFYRLEVPKAAARFEVPRLDGRLLVDSIHGDATTLERLMLYRTESDPFQVKRDGYDQWVESPPTMVQRAAVTILRSANAAQTVITPETRLDADFRLGGRVTRFERLIGEDAARASVEVEFSLVRLGDRELLLQATYREDEEIEGDDVGDSVAAFSRALHRLLGRLALDLPES